jgi:hypothetical protein
MGNVLLTPRAFKKKTIFMKVEPSGFYGIDAAPAPADWLEARDMSVTEFEASMVARNIVLENKGRVGGLVGSIQCKVEFSVALAPSGTAGTAPKWDVVMKAAAFAATTVADTSVTYNLVSTGELSATVHYYADGDKHVITGVRGSWSATLDANGLPMMKFSGVGVYAQPTTANAPSPVKTGWTVEEAVGPKYTTGTFNGVAVAFSKYTVDVAHQVKYISYPGPQEEVVVEDRQPTGSITLLAPSLATLNPYALAENGTLVSCVVNHGSAAGKKARITLQSRVTGVAKVDVDGYLGYDIKLEPEATAAGNDEIVLQLT